MLLSTTRAVIRVGETPLENFLPSWKNVLDIVYNYWTFKNLGPPQKSLRHLVSQAGYMHAYHSGFSNV